MKPVDTFFGYFYVVKVYTCKIWLRLFSTFCLLQCIDNIQTHWQWHLMQRGTFWWCMWCPTFHVQWGVRVWRFWVFMTNTCIWDVDNPITLRQHGPNVHNKPSTPHVFCIKIVLETIPLSSNNFCLTYIIPYGNWTSNQANPFISMQIHHWPKARLTTPKIRKPWWTPCCAKGTKWTQFKSNLDTQVLFMFNCYFTHKIHMSSMSVPYSRWVWYIIWNGLWETLRTTECLNTQWTIHNVYEVHFGTFQEFGKWTRKELMLGYYKYNKRPKRDMQLQSSVREGKKVWSFPCPNNWRGTKKGEGRIE